LRARCRSCSGARRCSNLPVPGEAARPGTLSSEFNVCLLTVCTHKSRVAFASQADASEPTRTTLSRPGFEPRSSAHADSLSKTYGSRPRPPTCGRRCRQDRDCLFLSGLAGNWRRLLTTWRSTSAILITSRFLRGALTCTSRADLS
jgi:hypothetical protein